MVSHSPAAPPLASNRSLGRDEAILRAVASGLRKYGPRKLTAQDIAQQAGISRMTFYRALGTMEHAVQRTLEREFARELGQLTAGLPFGSGATRLAMFLGEGARTLVDSALITAVWQEQPDLLDPFLTGASPSGLLPVVEQLLAEGRRDGSVCQGAPGALTLSTLMRGVVTAAPQLTEQHAFDQACEDLTRVVAAALAVGEPYQMAEHALV